jgi:hypothetical protein
VAATIAKGAASAENAGQAWERLSGREYPFESCQGYAVASDHQASCCIVFEGDEEKWGWATITYGLIRPQFQS